MSDYHETAVNDKLEDIARELGYDGKREASDAIRMEVLQRQKNAFKDQATEFDEVARLLESKVRQVVRDQMRELAKRATPEQRGISPENTTVIVVSFVMSAAALILSAVATVTAYGC